MTSEVSLEPTLAAEARTVAPARARKKSVSRTTANPSTSASASAKPKKVASTRSTAVKVTKPRAATAASASAASSSFPSSAAKARTATVRLPAPSRRAAAGAGVSAAGAGDAVRTSQRLVEILTKNPNAESFTVEQILQTLGTTSFGTSLMFFSLPEVFPIPVPGISALVVLPVAALGMQMAAGKGEVRLPKYLLERTVPRRALAAAVYAIVPALKKAEQLTKPRWKWASSAAAQRLLGIFVFVLALSIAFPIPGFNMPQAVSIFIIGLGLVEKDGLIICLGVVLGIASLALLGAVIIGLSSFLGF